MPSHVVAFEPSANVPEPDATAMQAAIVRGQLLVSPTDSSDWSMVKNGADHVYDASEFDGGEMDPAFGYHTVSVPAVDPVILHGDLTVNLATPAAPQFAHVVTYVVIQDDAGGHTFSIPNAATPGGAPLVVTATPGAVDVVRVQWLGDHAGWVVREHLADVKRPA